MIEQLLSYLNQCASGQTSYKEFNWCGAACDTCRTPDHEVCGGQERRKTLNHPQVGHLVFERLTCQVFDTPELKVTV
jgi:hypothetical protein